ncbi:MAG: VTT domain-containing protein [Thermodesulfobacteriota bacterium]|nr:VTT domain-containing protein [Thermodesulfobacteriota bacterium]
MTFKDRLKRPLRPFHLTIRWYNGLAKSTSEIKRGLSLGILGVIAFLSALGIFHVVDLYPLKDWINLNLTLNDMGISGWLTYILMVAILPLFSPLTLVIVTGSAAFGPLKGVILSYIGCIINANIAYLLVKALSIENAWGNSRRGSQIKNAIKQHGYILVMCLQLITIIPFTMINATAAGSGVSWKDFMKATSVGICPCILLYSFMGNKLVSNMVSPSVYFAGIFVLILLLIVISQRKKGVQRAAARSRQTP